VHGSPQTRFNQRLPEPYRYAQFQKQSAKYHCAVDPRNVKRSWRRTARKKRTDLRKRWNRKDALQSRTQLDSCRGAFGFDTCARRTSGSCRWFRKSVACRPVQVMCLRGQQLATRLIRDRHSAIAVMFRLIQSILIGDNQDYLAILID
jgi:hypothetical protein